MGNRHSKSRKQSKVAAHNNQKGQREFPHHRGEHSEDVRQARPTGPPIMQQVYPPVGVANKHDRASSVDGRSTV